jgi:hemoglobin-like flavoprotein
MTPEQMNLVRLSFARMIDIKPEAGRIFYDRLFSIAPQLRPMFKPDIEARADKFIEMLGVAIGLLKNPASLSRTLTDLAHRHRNYGVRDEHYEPVGAALMWTLEETLGDAFTPELVAAWRDLYTLVASAMKRAADPRAAQSRHRASGPGTQR